MITPVRLQLSRRWGFNLQRHSRSVNGLPAVAVTRPGPFDNPFRMRDFAELDGDPLDPKEQREEAVSFFAIWVGVVPPDDNVVDLSEYYPDKLARLKAALPQLKGHNLACWCPLQYPDGEPCPCHGDELLELLYGKQAEEPKAAAPWGCLYPGECLVEDEHQTSECCTEQTREAAWRQSEQEAFKLWWEAEGCHLKINRDAALAVWLAARSEYPFQA